MKKLSVLALAAFFAVASCKSNSDSATTSEAEEVAVAEGHPYAADLSTSKVEWKAFHKGGFAPRWGTINLSAGELTLANDEITAGSFEIDFTTIVVDPASVTEEGKKASDLQEHLKSPDFFNVGEFPKGTFEITGITDFDPAKDKSVVEGANKVVSGNLTLQGNTINVTFPARISAGDGTVRVEARFTVDRTAWGIKFGATEADPAEWGISKDLEIGVDLTAVAK